MLLRYQIWPVVVGLVSVLGLALSDDRNSCSNTDDDSIADVGPQVAMLQTRSERGTSLPTKPLSVLGELKKLQTSNKKLKAEEDSADDEQALSKVFRWGIDPESSHPKSIGKLAPHPQAQYYEARVSYLTGMVLNIFTQSSSGDGGLLLALEVPSPCYPDVWVEVDRSRCSSRYPCSLRLPGGAVRGSETEPVKFRTTVVAEDEDYHTDFLEYKRVTIDHDAEVRVAYEKFEDDRKPSMLEIRPTAKRILKFKLGAVMASGPLSVTPIILGADEGTSVTMRIRQPEQDQLEEWGLDANEAFTGKKVSLNQKHKAKKQKKVSHLPSNHQERMQVMDLSNNTLMQSVSVEKSKGKMKALESTLSSFRAPWSSEWRAPVRVIGGCDYALFEVVADQLYPGDLELEVWATGENGAIVSEVLVTSRVSWAEAEISLLESIVKDHFNFFLDPEVIVHGLAMDAYKKEDPKRLPDSNPTGWGYAMESWLVMAEMGVLTPQETVEKLRVSFETLEALQRDPEQFANGLFYPYYQLRSRTNGEKIFPEKTTLTDMPCGDDALFFASLMLVQGWLKLNKFNDEAETCSKIVGRMRFSNCHRISDCNHAVNGQLVEAEDGETQGDKFWSIPLTFSAETLEQSSYNWNVWADEGGVVAMIIALSGAINSSQYESVVRQQQRYSPCSQWEGITVGHTAFFNSVFTLPTRSMLGFGTLFAAPYYHEFAVRSVLPTFRAHQKLKHKLGVDYIGPSDAMTVMPKNHPGKVYGSYAYWPPNNMYDCTKGMSTGQNQCTWCKGFQYEGLDDPFDLIVPHGNMAAFLSMASMERSQFSAWLEDSKLLMTDLSGVYTPGYGLEVVAPARRTKSGGNFEGAFDGRNVWETLSHGYTILSMYEGLATMRRRYELAKEAGMHVPGSYEPPKYKPLSDFIDALPSMRSKINRLLAVASEQKSTERQCGPSAYGPAT